MRSLESLRQLADDNGIPLNKRLFTEDRETGRTVFFDVPKSRGQLTDELQDRGLLS